MLPGPDWLVPNLANLYLGSFIFGLILTCISAFFSFAHVGGQVDAPHAGDGHGLAIHPSAGHIDIHVPHGAHAPGSAHVADGHIHVGDTGNAPVASNAAQPRDERPASVSWLNMPTILAAITWFGGVGYLLTQTTALLWTIVLGAAVGAGLLGGYIIYFFFAKVLWPAQTPPMDPEEYALPGTPARVVSGIAAGGTGEILYTKGGTRAVAGARSVDGSPLLKGAPVRVVRYERGLAYVEPRQAEALTEPLEVDSQATTKLPPGAQI